MLTGRNEIVEHFRGMGRAEAGIFAAPRPVPREALAQVVGSGCAIDQIIAGIREESRRHPYDLVAVAGG